jgi:DNA-binding response OmpR family regulator
MEASSTFNSKTSNTALHLSTNLPLKSNSLTGEPKRILVIDDDKSILEVVEEALSYSNFEVKSSLNCENVFDKIAEFNPDLILLDFLLTGINGGELCHQVKTSPETMHIPVIMMSGFPKVFLSLGDYNCDFFITKPFNLDELLDTVNRCFVKETVDKL